MEWFRLYPSLLHKRKVQSLSDRQHRVWIGLLCVANDGDGVLPQIEDIAFELRISEQETKQHLQGLINRRLVDVLPDGSLEIHDWSEHQKVSDHTNERSRRYRE